MDTDDAVKPPKTIREYLSATTEAIDIFRWIFQHVVTPQSKIHLVWMLVSVVMMILMQSLQPAGISYIVNGLTVRDSTTVKWGLGIFLVTLLLQKMAQRKYDRRREHVLGLHWQKLDDVLARLFFEKSLGQHAHQSNLLSPTNIDKGKWRMLDIQRVLFFDGIPTALNLFISFICLFIMNFMAGLGMLTIMLIYIAWSLYLNSRIAQICIPIDKRFRALGRRRNERFERIERVLVSGKGDTEVQEMSDVFSEIITDDRAFWLKFIDIAFIRSAINVTGLSAIIAWGAWLVWKGEFSIGLLFPFISWASRVSENIWKLGDIEQQINWNLPAVKSMITAVSIPPSIVDEPDAVVIDITRPHVVQFASVGHSYPTEAGAEDAPSAVTNVTFDIKPGDKVALIGPSGGGKTTLLKKLLRFDDPTNGAILVDGINLKKITRASWTDGIGYIPQQSQVLDGTIRSNLTYGLSTEERENTTDDDLWALMKLLQIDFGKRMTNGLDTVVGRNGIKLSGGQAQRLMIGAAVIKKPWLLVVDEATSSLDSTTEKLVQEGLEIALRGRNNSALIVTHRLNTVRKLCNKFVVLKPAVDVKNDDSQVEAIADSFESLYEISSTFRKLADDQGIRFETAAV